MNGVTAHFFDARRLNLVFFRFFDRELAFVRLSELAAPERLGLGSSLGKPTMGKPTA